MIKIIKLTEAYGLHYSLPESRAALLGYAGVDYLNACILAKESHKQVGPLFFFRLPTMHQTLELLSKAVAFTADSKFDPRKYSHQVLKLMQDYASQVPIFSSILSYPNSTELLEGLEMSYLGVRYGECALSYDEDAWLLFLRIADDLLDDLRARTKLRFPQ
jgi:hypothetical protein